MITKYGITGSRIGWTLHQRDTFTRTMLLKTVSEWHHGDCEGIDAQTSYIIAGLFGIEVVHCHPPLNDKYRACFGGAILHEEKEYMERNQDIVDAIQCLVVIPKTQKEQLRSGTWATYRRALAAHCNIIIIPPDGIIMDIRGKFI